MPGIVYLVGAGPGDAGLITVRGRECLRRAEVVLADHLVNPELLDEAPATAEVVIRAPRRGGPFGGQDEINRFLVERAREGHVVVRLKGGDPFVFGRGGEEAEALVAAGIPFEVVPGITAAIAVPAYAGIPLTHRGLAGAVAFATGHEAGDKDGGAVEWQALARGANTLVLFMGVTHLDEAMRQLVAGGRAPSTPVAVIERGTTVRQRTLVATVADVAARAVAEGFAPPALVVVGEVVRLRERLAWFERRPGEGRRILVLSTKEDGELGLRSDGVETIRVAPLTVVPRFAEVKTALAHLGSWRLVAFASAHAVDALVGALMASGHDGRALAGAKLAAVGPATARRLGELHLQADLVGRGGGRELGAEIVEAGLRGPALILRAAGGRDELPDSLIAAGYEVQTVSAYETVADGAQLARAAKQHRLRPFDAVAFASPKGAHAFFDVLGGVAALGGALIGAIGETTRAALVEAGVAVHVVPAEPSLAELVDGLASALADRAKMG